ncbi:MAG: HlyD family type I secretion periplasmic adaptor subunit [Lentisphaeria bacterium]|nr:HlyD family type I secretion periplasmic adaptor subunit [Lentisphaeria bacterium]NQZ70553.1 HlyD family type I secretion periplasmic adaptor subunit [Lentisphaeria bacterium]
MKFFKKNEILPEDEIFLTDLSSAVMKNSHPMARLVLLVIILFSLILVTWSNWATVEQVTRGEATVVTSSHIQTIQNLEGGILSKMNVREGDIVEKGEVLLTIENSSFKASLLEKRSRSFALEVSLARLKAEVNDTDFTTDKLKHIPAVLLKNEMLVYKSRKTSMDNQIRSLDKTIAQIDKELVDHGSAIIRLNAEAENKAPDFKNILSTKNKALVKFEIALYTKRKKSLETKLRYLDKNLKSQETEFKLTRDLVKSGAVSKVESMRIERTVVELRSRIENTDNDFREKAALESRSRQSEKLKLERMKIEAEGRFLEFQNKFIMNTMIELRKAETDLGSLRETMKALQDKVNRSIVRSPVYGTIKDIHITTLGAVIESGEDLIDIVPLDDTLLIEAKIRPSDIAFISPKQKAVIKLTAYDFSIYGGLEGIVEHISSDTFEDNQQQQYYKVLVRTTNNQLRDTDTSEDLEILPGMTATVEIVNGKKTVMHYLAKPFIKSKDKAFTER